MKPFILTFSLFLFSVAAFNFVIDPFHRWHGGAPKKEWFSGDSRHPILVPSNYDERLFRRIELANSVPNDVVVFGSSRSYLFRGTWFNPKLKIRNLSVSNATVEDWVGLWQGLQEKQKLPRFALIFLDPWTFNSVNERTSWHTNMDWVAGFLRSESRSPKTRGLLWQLSYERLRRPFLSISDLITLEGLKSSIAHWKTPEHDRSRFSLSQLVPENRAAILEDGSLQYPASELQVHKDRMGIEAGKYYFDEWVSWKPNLMAGILFYELVQSLGRQGVRTAVITTPFSDSFMHNAGGQPAVLRSEVFKDAQLASAQQGGELDFHCGGFHRQKELCKETEYMDYMHVLPSCLHRIISQCFTRHPEWAGLLSEPDGPIL